MTYTIKVRTAEYDDSRRIQAQCRHASAGRVTTKRRPIPDAPPSRRATYQQCGSRVVQQGQVYRRFGDKVLVQDGNTTTMITTASGNDWSDMTTEQAAMYAYWFAQKALTPSQRSRMEKAVEDYGKVTY